VKQHEQGLLVFFLAGRAGIALQKINIDKIVIGRCPALALVLGHGTRKAPCSERRPNGLQIAAYDARAA
jgi:hypothetical protein